MSEVWLGKTQFVLFVYDLPRITVLTPPGGKLFLTIFQCFKEGLRVRTANICSADNKFAYNMKK